MRSIARTGSSRAIASRRSACCAGCRPRRCSRGGAATPPAGGTRASTASRRSACRSRRRSRTPPASPGGSGCAASAACALVYFGDGATSEGAFHEGANFAAVMRAPLVLLCNNNQWAISTPVSAQTAAATLADKAVGYGMPGVRVDGADVLAVYEATLEAVERARAGDGPTFIEAVTYRAAPHATADDPSAYIDQQLVEEATARRVRRPLRGVSPPPRAALGRGCRGDRAEALGRDASRDRGRRGGAAGRPGRGVRPRVRRSAAARATSRSCAWHAWLSGRSSRRSTTASTSSSSATRP